MSGTLAGTGKLIRLILRRDRILLPLWVLWMSLAPVNFVSMTEELFPTAADRQEYAATSGSDPAFLALFGPLHNDSLGGIVTQRLGLVPLIVALISILTVIRHTRTEEENGRRELLGATVIGRHAPLAAALTVTVAANLVLALIMTAGLSGSGQPGGASFAVAMQFAICGCVFAAVAAVAAQVTVGAGAARGTAIGALGVAYLLRLAGDTGGEGNALAWLSWLSPVGWAQQLRPFADERWWVLLPAAALTALLVAAAFRLSARRDLGAGLFAARPGPGTAAPSLSGPFGLAWRVHRGMLLAWVAGLAVLGAVFGGLAKGVGDALRDNAELKDAFTRLGGEATLVDTFIASGMSIVGLAVSGYAVLTTLRLRGEEENLRAEHVLTTPVPRLRWAAGHLLFAFLGTAAAVAAAGLTAGLVHGLNSGDLGRELPRILGGALVQLPAAWTLAAITVAAFGLLPRLSAAVGWGALVVFLFLGQFGALMGMSQRALDLSPFTHIPKLPGGDVSVVPLVWLVALTAALVALGLAGFRRRDYTV
ncbi:ABC transporter permease [Actinomadura sp. 6K520]|uniref:ABC transporter permease n=1 Tax=Actinomadura sp. 6K520 TaxID=2530364 RepID=UPI00104F2694|nr:ABC transporter permease [Actinomadura sp. 6K520]TDE25223.1 ABC transporter permease [Actinomadura sp. 6K520]